MRKEAVRALSVGLVAALGVIASLAVVRHRQEPLGEKAGAPTEPVPAAAPVDLEDLRAAGL